MQHIREAFKDFWAYLPRPTDDTVVRYVAKRGFEPLHGDFCLNAVELHDAAMAYTLDGFDFYIQPNPTTNRTKTRCNTSDITHWSWFFIDVDPLPQVEAPDPRAALDAYMMRLTIEMGGTLSPLIIDSGRGVQGWFRLPDVSLDGVSVLRHVNDALGQEITFDGASPEPELVTVPTRKMARKVMGFILGRLARECGVVSGCLLDVACSDLPRIMRCPFTINTKTGNATSVIQWGETHPDLWNRMIRQAPISIYEEQEKKIQDDTVSWIDVVNHLTFAAKEFIQHGAGEGSRHDDAVKACFSLRDQGLTRERVMEGLLFGNRKCRPEPMDVRELESIVKSAFTADLYR